MTDETSNVIEVDFDTRLDIPPERVIRGAANAGLEVCIVIGVKNDNLFFASSQANSMETLWYLEHAKRFLLGLSDESR